MTATEYEPTPTSPGTETRVELVWKTDEEFEYSRPGRPAGLLDGHGATAPSPVDALLGAIAGCASVDVVNILKKQRTPVRELSVEVVAQRANSTPKRILSAELLFRIAGAGIRREHAERAIDLSVEKYCSVRSSLDPAIPIKWSLELHD